MKELGEPVPLPAIRAMMQQVITNHEGWDEDPEWGLIYPPPLTMVAELAEQEGHDATQLDGLMAATMPVPSDVWQIGGDPLLVMDSFERMLTHPKNDAETEAGEHIRNGLAAQFLAHTGQPLPPPMGVWLCCEAFIPPERLHAEVNRRSKTGEKQINLSGLPDRVEVRCIWVTDSWGRNFLGQYDRPTGQFAYDQDAGDDGFLYASQPQVRSLRRILSALADPLPHA